MNRTWLAFAKTLIYFLGFATLAVCLILLPELARENIVEHPQNGWTGNLMLLAGVYILAAPVLVALFQTKRWLDMIGRGHAFTQRSVKTLATIKNCAIAFCILMVPIVAAFLAFIRVTAPGEDAPPFLMLGTIVTVAGATIAVFAHLLQRLVAELTRYKSENDLTV